MNCLTFEIGETLLFSPQKCFFAREFHENTMKLNICKMLRCFRLHKKRCASLNSRVRCSQPSLPFNWYRIKCVEESRVTSELSVGFFMCVHACEIEWKLCNKTHALCRRKQERISMCVNSKLIYHLRLVFIPLK